MVLHHHHVTKRDLATLAGLSFLVVALAMASHVRTHQAWLDLRLGQAGGLVSSTK